MTIIYYGDGTKYEGDNPPARDVQVIVQEHPKVGWHTQAKYDHYIWRDGRYVGVDRAGLWDELKERGVAKFNIGIYHQVLFDGEWREVDEYGLYEWAEQTKQCLFGRTVTGKEFNEIMRRALEDLGAAKTGWLSGEDKPNG